MHPIRNGRECSGAQDYEKYSEWKNNDFNSLQQRFNCVYCFCFQCFNILFSNILNLFEIQCWRKIIEFEHIRYKLRYLDIFLHIIMLPKSSEHLCNVLIIRVYTDYSHHDISHWISVICHFERSRKIKINRTIVTIYRKINK